MDLTVKLSVEALEKLTSVFIDGECCSVDDVLSYRLSVLGSWLDNSNIASLKQLYEQKQLSSKPAQTDSVTVRYSLALLRLLACISHCLKILHFPPTPNSSVPVSDSSVPVSDGSVPVSHSSVPVSDCSVPVSHSSVPVSDSSVPVSGGSVPVSHSSVPVSDSYVPVSDGSAPVSDCSVPVSDCSAPVSDSSVPVSDSSVPVSDCSAPVSDSSVPVSDCSVSVSDSSVPVSDCSAPVSDSSAPVSDCSAPVSGSSAPVLPPDTLGARQLRVLERALQFVVALAVLPTLPSGVGVPLARRSEFPEQIRRLAATTGDLCTRRAHALLCVDQLLQLSADCHQLHSRLLSDSRLADLLALLLLTADGPTPRLTTAGGEPTRQLLDMQRSTAAQLLDTLLTRAADVDVVCSLLLLQRCASETTPPRRWLQTVCWRRVYQLVGRPRGLLHVTQALLDFWGQDRVDLVPTTRIQAAAKLLASPPKEFHNEEYFEHLASEVMLVMRLPRPDVRLATVRVAGSLVCSLCDHLPNGDGHKLVEAAILTPLIGRLRCDDGDACADEVYITVGVTSVWQLFVVGMEPSAVAMDTLRPYLPALMRLYSVVCAGVSHLRAPCREILSRFLRVTSAEDGLDCLLFGVLTPKAGRFVAGDAGGVTMLPVAEDDSWLVEDDRLAAAYIELLCESDSSDAISDTLCRLLALMRRSVAEQQRDVRLESTGAFLAVELRQLSLRDRLRRGLICLRALAALMESPALLQRLQSVDSDAVVRLLPVLAALLDASDGRAPTEDELLAVQTWATALALAGVLLGPESSSAAVWSTARQCLLAPLDALLDDGACARRLRHMAADLRQMLLTNGAVNRDAELARSHSHTAADGRADEEVKLESVAARPLVQVIGGSDYRQGGDAASEGTTTSGVAREVGVDGALAGRDVGGDGRLDSMTRYERAMYEVTDPLLPVRAHAVTALSRLVQSRDPQTWSNRHKLLPIFQDCLSDNDSYLYLAAVRAVSCLADLCTAELLPELCSHYSASPASQLPVRDVETRLKLGEALVYMVKQLGDVAPKYGAVLLNTFLAGCRDPDCMIRASSLSNLAELCPLLRYSLSPVVNEILLCVTSLLDTDPSVEVRRAAVLNVSLLLRGLATDTFKVLEGQLLALYRRVRRLLAEETDGPLLQHATEAVRSLDAAVHQLLAPGPPGSMQKNIYVLDAPPH